MTNFWQQFPSKDILLKSYPNRLDEDILNVNAHLHTPYSYSAFSSVDQALKLASDQDVKVAGINDFYTTAGYQSWAETCSKFNIFPLFNIEFIGLSKIDQEKNIRINDPANSGRIYLSGKGLSYPFTLQESFGSQFNELIPTSNKHVKLLCDKLNSHLSDCNLKITLEFENIVKTYTKGLIRERHLAKALREKVFNLFKNEEERISIFKIILRKDELSFEINNFAALENEVRNRLLKSCGPAYIPENPDSFLSFEAIMQIVLKGGGIPTYPLLADDKNDNFTEFECDKVHLAEELKKRGIYSVEFIPIRNSSALFEEYASYFYENEFIVTFGSEHNTPDLVPIILNTRDKSLLSEKMRKINYTGACIIAAHQYLIATEGKGYLNSENYPEYDRLDEFQNLGNALIHHFTLK